MQEDCLLPRRLAPYVFTHLSFLFDIWKSCRVCRDLPAQHSNDSLEGHFFVFCAKLVLVKWEKRHGNAAGLLKIHLRILALVFVH